MHKIEITEQVVAVIVTAGLVLINFLLFTPWRNGHDPRENDAVRIDPKTMIMINPDTVQNNENPIKIHLNALEKLESSHSLVLIGLF